MVTRSTFACGTIQVVVVLAIVSGCGRSNTSSSVIAQENAKRPANRLAKETSPYLLLHAHNPVDWYPWGEEAFEKAKREKKPIFLSIGYSSCYWCHVMERLVFSRPDIAKQMNERFVNIKVDREERPDIDEIYMTALQIYFQAIGSPQGGGWPLSMFLTPDLKPLGGGTYFPPDDQDGRDGFSTIIDRISTAWSEKPDELQRSGEALARAVQNALRIRPSLEPVKLEQALVDTTVNQVLATGDTEFGGVDFNPQQPNRPKFPVPVKLSLMQASLKRNQAGDAAKLLYLTLDKLAHGGIHDQLGGGFHRYSTDRMWRVPHFEKMLYDNAQLADVFVTAYVATGNPLYRSTAEDTFSFVLKELTDPLGGFHSALDAETDGIEGQYYVWTRDEIRSLLEPDDVRLIARHLGLDREQFFEHGYVLEIVVPVPKLAEDFGIPLNEAGQRVQAIKAKLLTAREKRRALLRDDKILTSWNGLMIKALAHGAKAFNRPEYLSAAEKAARFILENMRDNGKLLRSYRAKVAKVPAYLDDYAYLIEGLIALYETTGEAKWLNAAARLMDQQIELFWDEKSYGFYFMGIEHEQLLARTKSVHDSVLPSGNSVSVRNLARLSRLLHKPAYRQTAEQTLLACAPVLKEMPRSAANMALALNEFLALDIDDTEEKKTTRQSGTDQSRSIIRDNQITLAGENQSNRRTTPMAEPSGKTKKPEHVRGKAYLSVEKLPPGKTCEFLVLLDVARGWHINPNPAPDEFAIETELSLHSKLKIEALDISYPPADEHTVPGQSKVLLCYQDQVEIRGILEIPTSAAGKDDLIEFRVRYQACNDKTCLPQKSLSIKVPVSVARSGQLVRPANSELFVEAP